MTFFAHKFKILYKNYSPKKYYIWYLLNKVYTKSSKIFVSILQQVTKSYKL